MYDIGTVLILVEAMNSELLEAKRLAVQLEEQLQETQAELTKCRKR